MAFIREEIDIVTIEESIDPPGLYHDNSFIGRVSTTSGTPINGAVVHIGNIKTSLMVVGSTSS